MAGRAVYDLRPDDIVRFRRPSNAQFLRDGMRVRDAERGRVLDYLRLGVIEIVRDGKVVRLEKPRRDARVRRGTQSRPCMCCGGPFASEGIHNRLCWTCRRENEWP